MSSIVALIMSAGRGSRFIAKHDMPKQYLLLGGIPVLRYSIEVFLNHPEVDDVRVVIHKDDIELYEEAVRGLSILSPVFGGDTRQVSVYNGLESLIDINPKFVLIHDAARPFVTKKIITSVIKQLDSHKAVIPAIPVDDTVKKCDNGNVLWTVDRVDLWRVQTPQGFTYKDIFHHHNINRDKNFTDDCSVMEYSGIQAIIVPGSEENFKITTDQHYERAEERFLMKSNTIETRVGCGFDIHKFDIKHNEHGVIMLGGIEIPYPYKLLGHSDADVLIHAVVDAILGAIGRDDIGHHFPDTDPQFKGANSVKFLEYARDEILSLGATIVNLDVTIICELPKIGPHRNAIKTRLASILRIDPSRVNIKGKTMEGLDAVGKKEAIEAHAVITVSLNPRSASSLI